MSVSTNLPIPVKRLLNLASAPPGTLNTREERLGAACREGIRKHGQIHGFNDGAEPFAGVLSALNAAIDSAAALPIAEDGPGSRRAIVAHVTDVLRQRTTPNADTTAQRLAEGLVTSILHRLGTGFLAATGSARDHAGLGLLCTPCGGPCRIDDEPETHAEALR